MDSLATAAMPGGVWFGEPIAATMTADEACIATDAPIEPMTVAEMQRLLVGRWESCAPGAAFPDGDGLQISSDGTFRVLRRAPSGELTPDANGGRVKVMKRGEEWGGHFQVDFERDGGGGTFITLPTFAAGNYRLRLGAEGAVLARTDAARTTTPTPAPDTTGGCSLRGVWSSSASAHGTAPASTGYFRFDGAGAFIGAPLADTCSAPTMKGTYRLLDGKFEIVSSEGMGCPSSYAAGWSAAFGTDCNTVTLTPLYDNCTGGRHSITDRTVLTRKL